MLIFVRQIKKEETSKKRNWLCFCPSVVLCALVLVGCGGGGNAYAGTTWELTRAEAYGVTMEGEMLDSTVGKCPSNLLTIQNWRSAVWGASREATYTLDGDKIMVTEGSRTMEFTVADEEISFEMSGVKDVFHKEIKEKIPARGLFIGKRRGSIHNAK